MVKIGSRRKEVIARALRCYQEGDYELEAGGTCYLHPKEESEKGQEMVKIRILYPREIIKGISADTQVYFMCRKGLESLANSEKPKMRELVVA